MSGQATGWVLRHGPCTQWAANLGLKKDRSAQAVLTAIADAANRDGENAHPGMAAMIDASGYARATVFEALDRLVSAGWVVVTEQGGGRGLATVYKIPGVSDPSWRPPETVQILDGADDENGPAPDAKGSSSADETVQISPGAPITQRSTNGTTNAACEDAAFAAFYERYPRRVGRGEARKAWTAARKKATVEQIMCGLEQYRAEVAGKEARYVKHPGPWLNAERWADEPGATAGGAKSGHARPIDTDRGGESGELDL